MEAPSAIPINRVNLLYLIDVDRIRIDRTRDSGSIPAANRPRTRPSTDAREIIRQLGPTIVMPEVRPG